MSHAKKAVLHCRHGYDPRLDILVEDFIRDGVMFVAVVGEDCSRVEDIITMSSPSVTAAGITIS